MLIDIGAHLRGIPMQDRVVFEELVAFIPFDELVIAAFGRMLGAKSGDPDGLALQCTLQRFYLPDMTAGLTVRYGSIKSIRAFFIDERFQQRPIRVVGLHVRTVFVVGGAPDGIGLGKEPTGVERKDGYRQSSRKDMMGDHLVLDAKAGGERYFPRKTGGELSKRRIDG